jgi:hypothetical protein
LLQVAMFELLEDEEAPHRHGIGNGPGGPDGPGGSGGRKRGGTVCVTNTHLFGNPEAPHVRMLQTALLLRSGPNPRESEEKERGRGRGREGGG